MRILSACPIVRKQPPGIVVSTAWWWRILFFGLSLRKVTFHLKKEEIRIVSRYLWFFRFRKRYRFGKVKAITYGYSNWNSGSTWSTAHDSLDQFSVGLQLNNDDEVRLFNFVGEGTFVNNSNLLPDWLFWDEYAFDLSGTQEGESKAFAELLSKLLNIPIVRPRFP
ncbi:MAG: hypothetical protein HON04_00220 [Planctomicrobium sp.]|jgi:hypothetical protein|nr:hypothetical protein [Planctomicrobium sp.]